MGAGVGCCCHGSPKPHVVARQRKAAVPGLEQPQADMIKRFVLCLPTALLAVRLIRLVVGEKVAAQDDEPKSDDVYGRGG